MIKYWCPDCDSYFILSDGYDNSNVKCPYCTNKNSEVITWLENADILDELGCMAIGFLKGINK